MLKQEDPGTMSLLNELAGVNAVGVGRPESISLAVLFRHWLLPPASRETCEKSLCCCWIFQRGISS